MTSQPSQIAGWHKILEDLNLSASPCETPPNHAAEDAKTSTTCWFQAIACFARTGFLRVLLNETPTQLELYVQIATGSALKTPVLLADALGSATKTSWTIHNAHPPFELGTTLPNIDDPANEADFALRNVFVALLKLGDLITNDTAELTQESIATALSYTSKPAETPTTSTTSNEITENKDDASQENVLFESIGHGSLSESTQPPNIDSFEITQKHDHLEIQLYLTTLLRPAEHVELAKALAHHLRARFDADVVPAPDLAAPAVPEIKTSIIRLEAESSEEHLRTTAGRTELADAFRAFFKKTQQWANLGIDIFELVGLKHAHSTPDIIQFTPTPPAQTSSQTQSPSPAFSTPTTPTSTPRKPAPSASSADNIVFDLSSQSASNPPAADDTSTFAFKSSEGDPLAPGNFTDPRLDRGDAVTPLVDLVLRHPGYSDRRIGQVLSIILSIDYHAALRLAENAPCVIAWGIAQNTAQNYKDVINTTGGKALLVEPDTFPER